MLSMFKFVSDFRLTCDKLSCYTFKAEKVYLPVLSYTCIHILYKFQRLKPFRDRIYLYRLKTEFRKREKKIVHRQRLTSYRKSNSKVSRISCIFSTALALVSQFQVVSKKTKTKKTFRYFHSYSFFLTL